MLTLFESVLILPNAHRFSFECLAKTGALPRGTPGSRDLLVGVGPDHMAREVAHWPGCNIKVSRASG